MKLLLNVCVIMAITLLVAVVTTEARSLQRSHHGAENKPVASEQVDAASRIFRVRRAVHLSKTDESKKQVEDEHDEPHHARKRRSMFLTKTEDAPEEHKQMHDMLETVNIVRKRRAAIMNTDEVPDDKKHMEHPYKLTRERRDVPELPMPLPEPPLPPIPGAK